MTSYPTRIPPAAPRRRVRRAQMSDAAAVASMVASAEDLRQVSPLEQFPLDASTVLHWLLQRDAGYVLEDRGEIVGYGELTADKGDSSRLWIGHMIVHPRRRGLGLGRRLVHELIRVAEHERGAREVAISAFADNERALRCYDGCGFVRVDRERVEGRALVGMRFRFGSRMRSPALLPSVVVAVASVSAGVLGFLRAAGAMVEDAPAVLLSLVGPAAAAWAAHAFAAERREPVAIRLRAALRPVGVGIAFALGVGTVALFASGARDSVGLLAGIYGSATLVWAALLAGWLWFDGR